MQKKIIITISIIALVILGIVLAIWLPGFIADQKYQTAVKEVKELSFDGFSFSDFNTVGEFIEYFDGMDDGSDGILTIAHCQNANEEDLLFLDRESDFTYDEDKEYILVYVSWEVFDTSTYKDIATSYQEYVFSINSDGEATAEALYKTNLSGSEISDIQTGHDSVLGQLGIQADSAKLAYSLLR